MNSASDSEEISKSKEYFIKINKAKSTLTKKEQGIKDIIVTLKKMQVKQSDIDYIIKGLNEIDELIKQKKLNKNKVECDNIYEDKNST